MPVSKIRSIVDTSFRNICGENYLFSLHWHGHPQIPTQLNEGVSTIWVVLSSREAIFKHRQALLEHEELSTIETNFILSSFDEFFDFIRADPVTANQLKENAIYSNKIPYIDNLEVDPTAQIGFLAKNLLKASEDYITSRDQLSLLALSKILNLSESDQLTTILDSLFNQFACEESAASDQSANKQSKDCPPIDFPAPIAIYQRLDKGILVTCRPVEALQTIDQDSISKWMQGQSISALQVATPKQLVEAVKISDMAGFRLMSYELVWGQDILESVTMDLEILVLNCAQAVTNLSIWQVGAARLDYKAKGFYLDEYDSKLVHDFQNRILNTQLQNELLARFKLTPKGNPDIVIPGREAPAAERLKAICDTFSWWSGFYLSLLDDMQ
ncbi:MAG: hypothetical protein AAF902_11690 [Chloroflexota bacterium]